VLSHLGLLARIAGEQEEWERAARLLKAARKGEASLRFPGRAVRGPGLIASVKKVPPEVTATTAWASERSMTLEQAVSYALQPR
jgi:hypothetical protein